MTKLCRGLRTYEFRNCRRIDGPGAETNKLENDHIEAKLQTHPLVSRTDGTVSYVLIELTLLW
jgi:hypothetical protein